MKLAVAFAAGDAGPEKRVRFDRLNPFAKLAGQLTSLAFVEKLPLFHFSEEGSACHRGDDYREARALGATR